MTLCGKSAIFFELNYRAILKFFTVETDWNYYKAIFKISTDETNWKLIID